jgi:hypothetical protein
LDLLFYDFFLQVNSGALAAVFVADLVRCVRYSLIRVFAENVGTDARDE